MGHVQKRTVKLPEGKTEKNWRIFKKKQFSSDDIFEKKRESAYFFT